MNGPTGPVEHNPGKAPAKRLEARIGLARTALLAEGLWTLFWPAGGYLTVYLALCLFDVWSGLPAALHAVALAGLAAASAYSLVRNLDGLSLPARTSAMRRLEAQSGLSHRPFDLVGDQLAAGRGDPLAEALWRAHRRQAVEKLRGVHGLWPHLTLAARDPRALRFLALLLLAAGLFTAGADTWPRLAKGFALKPARAAPAPIRVDAWIDPPAYTHLPPRFLTHGAAGPTAPVTEAVPVPAGAKLTLRIQGTPMQPRLRLEQAQHDPKAGDRTEHRALPATGEETYETTATLTGDARIELRTGLTRLAHFDLKVAADTPPRIAFASPIQTTARGAVRVAYRTEDDYGVTAITLRLRLMGPHSKNETFYDIELPPPDGPNPRDPGHLVRHANVDLTAHPWAGLPVQLTLLARDGAGQSTESAGLAAILPERSFSNPLARALAAARRDLMRDPALTGRVAGVIDEIAHMLTEAGGKPRLVLALRAAFWTLNDTLERGEDGRLRAAGLMWAVAVALEDGMAGEARTALDAAKAGLAEALRNNAPQAEIEARMAQLREALGRYLNALQAKMAEALDKGELQINPALSGLSAQDFARMLDTLENLARTGAKGEAQDLLSALDDILQNLTTGQPGQPSPADAAREKALQGLSELVNRQRKLMDDTYRATQSRDDIAAKPDTKALRGLAEQQEQLRRALGEAMTGLGEKAGAIPKPLARAERAMNAAREALAAGRGQAAVDREKEALEHLRSGARDLAQALAQSGQGAAGRARGIGSAPSADPFGRPNAGLQDSGEQVKVPDRGEAQQARDILEEIRRRAAERGRPAEELQYLDRLLERF